VKKLISLAVAGMFVFSLLPLESVEAQDGGKKQRVREEIKMHKEAIQRLKRELGPPPSGEAQADIGASGVSAPSASEGRPPRPGLDKRGEGQRSPRPGLDKRGEGQRPPRSGMKERRPGAPGKGPKGDVKGKGSDKRRGDVKGKGSETRRGDVKGKGSDKRRGEIKGKGSDKNRGRAKEKSSKPGGNKKTGGSQNRGGGRKK